MSKSLCVLAVQMDVTLPQVDASVDSNGVNELAHFAAGLQYCFAKDRSFDDPLRSKSEDSSINIETTNTTPLVPTVSRTVDRLEVCGLFSACNNTMSLFRDGVRTFRYGAQHAVSLIMLAKLHVLMMEALWI